MIEFEHVTSTGKGFHLQDISFCLENGYIMALAGENGAGKTTLLRHIMDENVQYQGKILIDGVDLKEDRKCCLNKLAYVSDDHRMPSCFTAKEIGSLYQCFYERWDQEMLEQYFSQWKVPANAPVSELSRGEFCRMQLALGLAHHATVFLMDEVTGGMDPVFRRELWRTMRNMAAEDVDIILVTHIMDEIQQKCDYQGIMQSGKLIRWGEVALQ